MLGRREFLCGAASLPLASFAQAQPNSPLTFGDALGGLFSRGSYSGLLKIGMSGPGPGVSPDDAAQAAAFVGLEHRAATYLSDRFTLNGPPLTSLRNDPLEEIARRAASTRVVILSEWHHAPRHRWFLGELLRRLSDHGYRTLAAETFSPLADGLVQGDVLLRTHGLYLNDTVFARAVRAHLAGGGRLASYDTGAPDLSNLAREALQIQNLAAVIGRLPAGAKLIVHAGPGHGLERSGAMAGGLKSLTGIDPLTIGQRLDARPLRRESADGLWCAGDGEGHDIVVHHFLEDPPRARPGWVRAGWRGGRVVRRPATPASTPLLVKAQRPGAPANAIPIDVAVFEAPQREVRLLCSASDDIVFEQE